MTSTSEYSVREQRGWYLYDWANSPYFTSVLLVFLGFYLTAVAKSAADATGFIHPFGIPVDARSLYPYLISISVAGQVIFLPVVGAIADYGHRKKELLALTAFLGFVLLVSIAVMRFGQRGASTVWADARICRCLKAARIARQNRTQTYRQCSWASTSLRIIALPVFH